MPDILDVNSYVRERNVAQENAMKQAISFSLKTLNATVQQQEERNANADQYLEQARIAGFGDIFEQSLAAQRGKDGNLLPTVTPQYLQNMYNLNKTKSAISDMSKNGEKIGFVWNPELSTQANIDAYMEKQTIRLELENVIKNINPDIAKQLLPDNVINDPNLTKEDAARLIGKAKDMDAKYKKAENIAHQLGIQFKQEGEAKEDGTKVSSLEAAFMANPDEILARLQLKQDERTTATKTAEDKERRISQLLGYGYVPKENEDLRLKSIDDLDKMIFSTKTVNALSMEGIGYGMSKSQIEQYGDDWEGLAIAVTKAQESKQDAQLREKAVNLAASNGIDVTPDMSITDIYSDMYNQTKTIDDIEKMLYNSELVTQTTDELGIDTTGMTYPQKLKALIDYENNRESVDKSALTYISAIKSGLTPAELKGKTSEEINAMVKERTAILTGTKTGKIGAELGITPYLKDFNLTSTEDVYKHIKDTAKNILIPEGATLVIELAKPGKDLSDINANKPIGYLVYANGTQKVKLSGVSADNLDKLAQKEYGIGYYPPAVVEELLRIYKKKSMVEDIINGSAVTTGTTTTDNQAPINTNATSYIDDALDKQAEEIANEF